MSGSSSKKQSANKAKKEKPVAIDGALLGGIIGGLIANNPNVSDTFIAQRAAELAKAVIKQLQGSIVVE